MDWNDPTHKDSGMKNTDATYCTLPLASRNAEVDQRYNELVERRGPVRDHPDFHSYSSRAAWGSVDSSPVTADELVTMSPQGMFRASQRVVELGTWRRS